MVSLLMDLIQDFITGSSDVLNSVTRDMSNMVFFMEKELLTAGNGLNGLDFNRIYEQIFYFAIILLSMIFAKKMLETYFFWQSGDPDSSPVHLVVRYIKALIVIMFFGWFYRIFVSVMTDLLTRIQSMIFPSGSDIGMLLQSQLKGGFFISVACLLMLILLLSLAIQFVMRGIEMLILRISIPIACVGLINSDGGAFNSYIKKFLQNAFTVIIQISLLNLSIIIMANGGIIYSIAVALVAVKTPGMLSEFMISVGAPKMNSLSAGAKTVGRGISAGAHSIVGAFRR